MGVDWLKKAKAAKAAASPKETEVQDEAFQSKHPALFAFLAQLTDDGAPRELCKIQLFADQGHWKAALHDGNTESSLFLTLGKPQDVFLALEKALTADAVEWRSWTKRGGKKRT